MTVNRKALRAALATNLQGAMTTIDPGNIYSYQVSDFGGQSPVLYLTSSGSGRRVLTPRGGRSSIYLNAHIFVLYSDQASAWTEKDAEDKLDDVEQELAMVLLDPANWHDQLWDAIDYDDRSNADVPLSIGGQPYLHEVIPIKLEVFA